MGNDGRITTNVQNKNLENPTAKMCKSIFASQRLKCIVLTSFNFVVVVVEAGIEKWSLIFSCSWLELVIRETYLTEMQRAFL